MFRGRSRRHFAQILELMFFGTTPQIISQWIEGEIKRIKPKRVLVPFSGNFVIEQIAGIVDKNIEVVCTDVSLYSRAIGYAINDTKSEIKLKEEYAKEFPAFQGDLNPVETAACIIFFTELGKALSKKDKIPYYKSLYKDAKSNQNAYKEQIIEKIEKFKSNLGKVTFLGTDGVDLARSAKKGDFVFYDPPVILGDYEKQFQQLCDCFNFDEPEYTQMTDEVKDEDLKIINESGAHCYYRTNNPVDDLDGSYKEVFRYKYDYHKHYCVYANKCKNDKNNTWVGRFNPLKEEAVSYPIMMADDEITENSKVKILKVSSKVSNHYRLLWVKKAEMKDTGFAYLVFVNEKVVGVIQLMEGVKFGSDLAVLMSDPATPTSKYKRLSKLIIYLASTEEMLEQFNEDTLWEHVGLTTRVFTNAAVSMKYRGLFKLVERKEDKNGFYKYCLIYQNRDKIFKTSKEALQAWVRKHAKVTNVTLKKKIEFEKVEN